MAEILTEYSRALVNETGTTIYTQPVCSFSPCPRFHKLIVGKWRKLALALSLCEVQMRTSAQSSAHAWQH